MAWLAMTMQSPHLSLGFLVVPISKSIKIGMLLAEHSHCKIAIPPHDTDQIAAIGWASPLWAAK